MSADRTYPFASYPAVRLTLLLIAGMVSDYHLNPSFTFWLILSGGSVFIYFRLESYHSRSINPWYYNSLLISYMFAVIAFGGTWHSAFDKRDLPAHAEILNAYLWEELEFSGRIYQFTPTASGKINLDIAIDTTFVSDSLEWSQSFNLKGLLAPEDLNENNIPEINQRIRFSATIFPLKPPRNPHEFDYRQYLYRKKIYVRAGINNLLKLSRQEQRSVNWLSARHQAHKIIDHTFSKPAAPLAKALILGQKQELAPDVRTSFSRAGLSHLMAVSGLHVGFLLIPFWFIIPYFWTLRYGKHIGLILLILMLFLYAGIIGFSASVTRASLGGGFLMYARLFHKVSDSKNLMAVAAMIILLWDPGQLFFVGFQLSFSAVYIILLVMPVFNRYAPEGFHQRWYGKLSLIIGVSLVVQTGLFPLLTYYFGEFSFIGPFTNALVIPILSLILPYALMLLPLGYLIPVQVQTLMQPVDIFLTTLTRFADWSAKLPWSWVSMQTQSLLLFGVWIAAIFFLGSLKQPPRCWKYLVMVLAGACLHQGQLFIQNIQTPFLKVTVLDVGQGDATLVQTPLNRHFLIDTGRWQPGYNSAQSVIIPHLRAEGILRLNGIFLSHPHADHLGGIIDLMQSIPIDTIYRADTDYDSQLFRQFKQQAREKNIPIKTLTAGNRPLIDPSIRIFAYGPAPRPSPTANINNHSLILELIYGSKEFLFMGDAEAPQEVEVLSAFKAFTDTDFLKVAHHGSNSSSTSPFLLQSTPDIAVISVGKSNRFQHPHRQTVNRLRKFGADVYFTSLQGALLFESDGRSINRQKW